ncbi:MAG: nicotinate-nucleotide adenylyltransferase [Candidatus Competibacteraceae bacterium]|nr:nicotinate-nucleotide adenylyltransferase [Candidatus Competibacteraceae bacterium]
MLRKPIGILGGTFDPIHYGHLRPALELLEALALAEIRFIPCRIPAHRATPAITPDQRLKLVRLATADQAGFVVDERELCRPGRSYMVDTLTSLREELGDTPLCLIIGVDAFRELHTWHRWQDLSELSHLIVMQRPGASSKTLPPVLEAFVAAHLSQDAMALRQQPAGRLLFQAVTQLDISATQIRALLASGQSPRYLLPEAVLAYIRDRAMYQPLTPSTPATL